MNPSAGSTGLRGWSRTLRRQALTVWFAARDPRTPRRCRWLALGVAAYAFSPIDLIPDFIPVLGLLDDLLLVPLGVWLVLRCLPTPVLEAARERARAASQRPVGHGAAVAIVTLWLVLAALAGWGAWIFWGRAAA